jgi:hypothetical protein
MFMPHIILILSDIESFYLGVSYPIATYMR